jgi:hypothetical protein
MDGVRSENLIQKLAEFDQSRAWNNDSVASSVGFFCDSKEAAAVIFAEFDKKVFAFDLEFS